MAELTTVELQETLASTLNTLRFVYQELKTVRRSHEALLAYLKTNEVEFDAGHSAALDTVVLSEVLDIDDLILQTIDGLILKSRIG